MRIKLSLEEEIVYNFFLYICKDKRLITRTGFKPGYQENNYFKVQLEYIRKLLANGWTPEQIALQINDLKQLKITAKHAYEVINLYPPTTGEEKENLIKEKQTYSHPLLKEVVLPLYDEDDNLLTPASVSRRECFTYSDLIQFYYDTLKPRINRRDILNCLKYLINSGNKLDDIIRAIELCGYDNEEDGNDPWMLNKYIKDARRERYSATTGDF